MSGHGGLTVARWLSGPAVTSPTHPAFMFDDGELPARLPPIGVVLRSGGLSQARARLAAGARQVLLADAALADASLVRAAVAEFGAARLGVWLPAARMEVCWSLDSQSNGDFKCMVPSDPQARWEVLASDMRRTGIDACRWIEQLVRQGASTILVSVDMRDERDLDLCAGLMERFTHALWFSPLAALDADLTPWVDFGRVTRLVLPAGADARAEQRLARAGASRTSAELTP